ncbi:MAG: hypothetical protein CMK59_07225 [Proteobacteria bacterium]|nr:hypothetical protein [Pseudomonadota bacterium]
MSDDVDLLFERAMCDHWWLGDSATIVKRAEIEYLKSDQDNRLFNAVLRVSPQHKNPQQLVEEVMLAHQGKGSEWRIGAPSYTPLLEKAVLQSGYTVDGFADAWTIDVNASRPPAPEDIVVRKVDNLQQMRDMDMIMCTSFPKSKSKEDAELEKELRMCTGKHARCLRFVAYNKNTQEPLSTGGLNLYPHLAFGFMWGGCTAPHARGRGVYSAVVTSRMKQAKIYGLKNIGLYAMRTTSGPIVEAQRFTKHGPIFFWGTDHIPTVS